MDNMQASGSLHPKATFQRKNVLASDLIAFLALMVFVSLVVAIDHFLKPALEGQWLLVVGLALALVPALLWMFMFYRLDSVQPEPVTDVARIFVIGLALASALGIPLTDQFFHVRDWLYRDALTTLLGAIFIIGGVQAFIVFVAVRFFIYDEPEFDERCDGVVYGTAAGLGYATAMNLQFILANHGAAIGPGEIFVAEVALVHAALGGLLGYFLGKAKMQREPVWWLPLGFILTMLIGGLFTVLLGQVEEGVISIGANASLPSFTGLLLSGALAVAMSLLVAALIRRDVRLTLAGKMPPRATDADVGDGRATGAVIGTFAVTLVIGALVWNGAVNTTRAFDSGGVRGAYPSYYTRASSPDVRRHVADSLGSGAEFTITASPADAGQTVQDAATLLAADRGSRYAVYKVLDGGAASVGGAPALRQRFAYVDSGGLGPSAPQMKQGIDYIVITGGRAIVVTLVANPDKIQEVTPLFMRFVNSLSL
ncbi:MAG: PrsW family glutamic-type intramembrane protease [Chloroflexi bacterium]|nr:PrsW family glutamic-type intramembrane protease [Chloroflexota bacterium]